MSNIYKQGMTDPYVGTIQKSLLDAGYDVGPIDNIYGSKTAGAVKQFQTDRGITADSIWGPQTQSAYDTFKKLPTSSTTGTTGTPTGGTVLPDTTYTEGDIKYDRIGGKIYKNGVLVPEKNLPYIPSAIGGTRGVTTSEVVLPKEVVGEETTGDGEITGDGEETDGKEKLDFQWSPEVLALLEALTKGVQTPFSYDPTTDPLYGPMKEQYTQAGRAAFENTIGRLSALTGGRPSTAAVGTAAGASNQYQQQFAGTVLPELTKQAYTRHQDQRSNEADLLGILMDKDITEFDKKYAIEEFEWSRSEDNPAVRAQILSNMINEFKVDHLEEEWGWKVREWESRLVELDLLDKYAPELAAIGRDKLREELTQAQMQTRQMEEGGKETADMTITPTNRVVYNSRRDKLFKDFGDDYQAMLEHISQREDLYVNGSGGRDGMGKALYDQLIEEVQGKIDESRNAVPKEPEQSALYKEADTTVANIMKNAGKAIIDSAGDETGTTPREPLIKQSLDYLKSLVESGIITADEAQAISKIRGISQAEIQNWSISWGNPAGPSDFR